MINVCMIKDKYGPIGFEAQGHAFYKEQGKDIVCSAVSAIIQTAILGLQQRLKIQLGLEMKEGYIYCVLGRDVSETEYNGALIILDTMLLGLEAIKAEYTGCLDITQREV